MGEPGFAATGVPPPGARSVRREGRSLRQRVTRLLIAGLALQLVLVVLTIGTAVLAALDGLHAVAVRGTEITNSAVLAGMADQQSGLLAYLNAPGDAELLLVYTQGQQETDTSLRDLRADTAGTSQAGAGARVESDARAWERWAEGARLLVRSTGLPLTDPAAVGDGRQLFAVFRADQQNLVSLLEADSPSGPGSTLGSTL